jgi:hypothetical protein
MPFLTPICRYAEVKLARFTLCRWRYTGRHGKGPGQGLASDHRISFGRDKTCPGSMRSLGTGRLQDARAPGRWRLPRHRPERSGHVRLIRKNPGLRRLAQAADSFRQLRATRVACGYRRQNRRGETPKCRAKTRDTFAGASPRTLVQRSGLNAGSSKRSAAISSTQWLLTGARSRQHANYSQFSLGSSYQAKKLTFYGGCPVP